MVAWLSWLERLIHIEEVRGSNPLATTMISKPPLFKETVLKIASLLEDCQYAFRGTTGLVLQGLEMNVDDIDILCDKKTALATNKLLKEYLLEEVAYKESPKFKSYFGKFEINGTLVEIMGKWQIKNSRGDWSNPFDASDNETTQLKLDGQKVVVTSIETELLMFTKMGRWTAYRKIKGQLLPRKEINQRKLF